MHSDPLLRRLTAPTAVAIACAVLALAPAATASALAPSAAGSAPRCATSALVIWLDTTGSGTAGSIYYDLELTNLSGHPCTLLGYPGVSAVNLAGHQLGSAASRNTAHAPRLVTLTSATATNMAGATATVVLRIVEAGNFPQSSCRQVTAAGLRVFPPGQRASKVVPFPFGACSRTGPVILQVEAVQTGTGADG
jgi:hypothetical protein